MGGIRGGPYAPALPCRLAALSPVRQAPRGDNPPRQGASNTFVSAIFRHNFQNAAHRLSPRKCVDLPASPPNVKKNPSQFPALPVCISLQNVQRMLTLNSVSLQSAEPERNHSCIFTAESSCTFFIFLCLTNLPPPFFFLPICLTLRHPGESDDAHLSFPGRRRDFRVSVLPEGGQQEEAVDAL